MLGILSELGYDVEWEVLNSKDFGVPQNRERIFIKGYSRRKCGGEILSAKRGRREIIDEIISNSKLIKLNNKAQAQTIYDSNGLSTTLSANGGGQGGKTGLYMVKETKLNQINNDKPHSMAERIYDSDGLSTTLRGCGGGQGGKTGLYKVGNTNPSGNGMNGNVYSEERLCPSLTTNKGEGLKVCVEESEIKKCWGSTQKHRAETDGSISPTLTSAMGGGGGHVPMIERDKPEFVRMHGSNQEHRMISEDTCCSLNTHRTPMVEYDKPLKVRTAISEGYVEADVNDGVRLDHPGSNARRGTVQKEGTDTISAKCDWGTVDKDYRIRRLTPKECERLQGFPDNWTKYGKGGELISDTQRYKCCGNAVTVNVIEYLIRSWFG